MNEIEERTAARRQVGLQGRILIALGIVVAIGAAVIGLEALRARRTAEPALAAGAVPIYLDGRLVAGFTPADLDQLEKVGFTEPVEGKLQEGWLLRDILLLHVKASRLDPAALVAVSSTSRGKSARLTWAEVAEPANWVMFDLSNRGTLKLVSILPVLDSRDEWVQDADRIEITTP